MEAKRTEKLNIRAALRQAIGNVFKRKSTDVPIVITRKNNENLPDSIVALRLSDFTDLLTIALHEQGYINNRDDPLPIIEDVLQHDR